jgi:hypothetical protein
MAQYAVWYPDKLVVDHSWTCVADVLLTYHGGFCDERGKVTGVLVTREGDDHEWVEVADVWADERADVLARFTAELKRATGDGSKKRRAGTKPPWYEDDAHEGAIFSHLTKWKRGETVDPDSGAHTLVHLAWRALAIACQETGNIPDA